MASAVAQAIWGKNNKANETNGQEPVSGQQGNTSKGEPFDNGNSEHATKVSTEPATETAKKPTFTDTESSAEFSKTTGTAAESEKISDNPSTELKSKDTPADTTKGQNDVGDPEDPKTNPKNQATDVDNTGDGPNEAQKLDEPGPKPLEDIAKAQGGDAGASGPGVDNSAGDKPAVEEPEDGPGAKSTGEGTGNLYVKSTGFKADGGDFDVTKPGAGREAERLLEDKGIHRETPAKAGDGAAVASDESVDESGKKKSPFAKIKEKLHKH